MKGRGIPAHHGLGSPVQPSPAPPWAPHCYFVAKDVAECLGYAKVSDAVRWHCRGVQLAWMPTAVGRQQAKIIPESDVYRLIDGSHLPGAERFKDWGNEAVLPSIRKLSFERVSTEVVCGDSAFYPLKRAIDFFGVKAPESRR